MANAKRCDMCGKYYELYSQKALGNRDANGIKFVEVDALGRTSSGLHYDCCPACLGLLVKIIKEKRKDGGLE